MNRPVGVWLVTVYAALNALIGAVGFYMLFSGAMPAMSGEQASFFANLSVLDYALSALLHTSIGLGGALLFMLRKRALSLFVAGAVFNLAQTVWHIVTHRFMAGVGGASPTAWTEFTLAWAIIFAIIIYTALLSRRGVLT